MATSLLKAKMDENAPPVPWTTTEAAVEVLANAISAQSGGATADPVRVNSTAAEASHVLKAAAGVLVSVVGHNSGPSQFIQVHDAESLPADTAVPALSFYVLAGQNFSYDIPTPFSTGIVVCNSSTLATKTIGAADCFFTAVVR